MALLFIILLSSCSVLKNNNCDCPDFSKVKGDFSKIQI
jgi:hypothetical protein